MIRTLTALWGGLVISACSSSRQDAPTATEGAGNILALDENSGQDALDKKYADYSDDVVLKDGRVQKESKRSAFEGKQISNIGGDLGNKEYAANRYTKKNWNSNKKFARETFVSSKNDWEGEEWFLRKQAEEAGSGARSQEKAYLTENFATSSAREQSGLRLPRPSNLQTDIAQRDNPSPRIFSKEDYDKLSLSDSKRLLGR